MTKDNESVLGRIMISIRRRFCKHGFRLRDLVMVNCNSDGNDRVRWNCFKCGRVFNAHCGLDISPKHGPIVGK